VLESEDGGLHGKKRDGNALALALWPLHHQTFDECCASVEHSASVTPHQLIQATSNTATVLESGFLGHLNLVLFLQLSPIAFVWV
jgi:hypothetical protein